MARARRNAGKLLLAATLYERVAEEKLAAGAPKPVFYRIYPSRADLIDSLFQHVHDTILKTQQGK